MKFQHAVAHALTLGAAALLCGCGASISSPLVYSTSSNESAAPPADAVARIWPGMQLPATMRSDQGKSWVAPDAGKTKKILFETDGAAGANDLYMFALPSMKLKGKITGLNGPQGECSDPHGNVWVANLGAQQILEYSHAGKLMNTIADSYGYPSGCAVNYINGDLAVTNYEGPNNQPGNVLVFTSPSAKPTVLNNPQAYLYFFAGYDPTGVLWVDGFQQKSSNDYFILSKCDSSTCTTVNLSGRKIYAPGLVQWDTSAGKLVVGDQSCDGSQAACLYKVSKNGHVGRPTKLLSNTGQPLCDLIQGVLSSDGKTVAGGDFVCASNAPSEYLWSYPPGGNATSFNDKSGIQVPDGAAISVK